MEVVGFELCVCNHPGFDHSCVHFFSLAWFWRSRLFQFSALLLFLASSVFASSSPLWSVVTVAVVARLSWGFDLAVAVALVSR